MSSKNYITESLAPTMRNSLLKTLSTLNLTAVGRYLAPDGSPAPPDPETSAGEYRAGRAVPAMHGAPGRDRAASMVLVCTVPGIQHGQSPHLTSPGSAAAERKG